MKIDIVPLVVIVFCVGVAVSALLSSDMLDGTDEMRAVAQAHQ